MTLISDSFESTRPGVLNDEVALAPPLRKAALMPLPEACCAPPVPADPLPTDLRLAAHAPDDSEGADTCIATEGTDA